MQKGTAIKRLARTRAGPGRVASRVSRLSCAHVTLFEEREFSGRRTRRRKEEEDEVSASVYHANESRLAHRLARLAEFGSALGPESRPDGPDSRLFFIGPAGPIM